MANKLPNEEELLKKLSEDKVVLTTEVWNLIYSNVEDNLSVVKLLLALYLDQNQNVPSSEIKKIADCMTDVSMVFRKLINPQLIKDEDRGFIKIKEENKILHPIIKNMFGHYIGNDVQAINFMIGDFSEDNGLEKDTSGKILERIASMEEFLLKLKSNMEAFQSGLKPH